MAATIEFAFVNRCSREHMNATGSTEFGRGLDVTRGGPASRAGLNSRFDIAVDVVEMVNEGMTEVVRQRFATTNYFVTALQVKRTRIVREDLRVANNYRDTALSDFIFSNR